MGHLKDAVPKYKLDQIGAFHYLFGAICAEVDYPGADAENKMQAIRELTEDFKDAFPSMRREKQA